jgi:hypothetical protein
MPEMTRILDAFWPSRTAPRVVGEPRWLAGRLYALVQQRGEYTWQDAATGEAVSHPVKSQSVAEVWFGQWLQEGR